MVHTDLHLFSAFKKAAITLTIAGTLANSSNADKPRLKQLPEKPIPVKMLYAEFNQRCEAFSRHSKENPDTHFISAEALSKLIENPKIEHRYALSDEQKTLLMLIKKIVLTPTGKLLLKNSIQNQIMFAVDNDIDWSGYYDSGHDFAAIRLKSKKSPAITQEILEKDPIILADYIHTFSEEMSHANQRCSIARGINLDTFRMDVKSSGFCLEAHAKTEASMIMVELRDHDETLFQACLKNKGPDIEMIHETAKIYETYGRVAILENAGLLQSSYTQFWHSIPATNNYFKNDEETINRRLNCKERIPWKEFRELGKITGCKGNIFDGTSEDDRIISLEQLIDVHLNPEADIAIWFRECRYAIANGQKEPFLKKPEKEILVTAEAPLP